MMLPLAQLLSSLSKRKWARHWLGPVPLVPKVEIAQAILGKIGYPARADCVIPDDLVKLDRAQAAHVLALAGTTSLAYGPTVPEQAAVNLAVAALDDLAADSHFWSNGVWDGSASREWNPLTEATFDCGVIGHDSKNAFVFWVEEED